MPQFRAFAPLAALVVAAPCLGATSADFRIVELTGQSQVTAGDHILDLAVQVKLTTTTTNSLGSFGFNIHIPGEPESAGTLSRGIISNSDGTYSSTLATNSQIGIGGIAHQYAYLAGLSSMFNGLINTSASTFTNGPDQEVGLVTGALAGQWLLDTPGIDADQDGNPDTWSGNNTGATPASGAFASIPIAISRQYFARNQYIDVYHFRYNVSDLSTRTLHFTLEEANAGAVISITHNGIIWGAPGSSLAPEFITTQSLDIAVPAPAGALLAAAPAIFLARRSRRATAR